MKLGAGVVQIYRGDTTLNNFKSVEVGLGGTENDEVKLARKSFNIRVSFRLSRTTCMRRE